MRSAIDGEGLACDRFNASSRPEPSGSSAAAKSSSRLLPSSPLRRIRSAASTAWCRSDSPCDTLISVSVASARARSRSSSLLRSASPTVTGWHLSRERAGPCVGPTRSVALHSRALRPLTRRRPEDQAGARKVGELVWILPGLPALGGGWPPPRGTAQQPVTSRVSSCSCKLDHLLPLVPLCCRRPRATATTFSRSSGVGR